MKSIIRAALIREILRKTKTPTTQTRSLPAYFLDTGRFIADKNYYVERENFDFYLIMYTIQGEGYLKFNQQEYIMKPHSVALIDCNALHSFEIYQDNWELIWTHVAGDGLRTYYNLITNQNHYVYDDVPIVEDKMMGWMEYFDRNDLYADIDAVPVILDFFTFLIHERYRINEAERTVPQGILDAIEYMRFFYAEDLTLELLAAKAYMSTYHFIRRFRDYTGTTPHEYLLTLRIAAVKRMLQETNVPIKDIAEKTGFSNTKSLAKIFKRVVGMTATEYRNMIRSQNHREQTDTVQIN